MHHSRAIILKKEEWGEADWMVTAFTEDFGKMRFRAQGARKSGAKLRGHLEPGTIAELSFVAGRNGCRLTGASLRAWSPDTRASLAKLRALERTLSLLDQNLWEEREGSRELFADVASALSALEGARTLAAVRRISVWVPLRLLRALGVLPPRGSPEAVRAELLIALAERSATECDGGAEDPDILEAELGRLAVRIGSAVLIPSVSFVDLTV
ncbi:MAG: DNA repair protein RecO [Candidatus Sungbacteria bacterium RIFCSPLOWO2_01_FULL_59_16]|uniref:DNA repair protein RecO n=1 Tax=Candidatus Sungbacteria bacterium RIFCSPLOWO2_01_FULL_59_16 TaxID=1802280 RepID=A0A1G2LE58_9BACT|nr:MAG: DNA repair protein RecO [Candidatus Sungbacteria bacterium RIFCSPLOWO2_01_FULL_59_16]